jgi:large subunit ribosomal protein L23
MKAAQDIVIAPIITEKTMSVIADKKYTFKVATDANKVEIAAAIEKLFGVEVAKVNTMNVRGHKRRMGRYVGTTAAWKKAVVTLSEKSKTIDFFDGLM